MLRDNLVANSGVGLAYIIVIKDADHVWQDSGATSIAVQHGYYCLCTDDAATLRYHYEQCLAEKTDKLLIDYIGSYIPYDIGRDTQVFDATLSALFPNLHTETLKRFTNINLDLLDCAYSDVRAYLSGEETEAFYVRTIWKEPYLSRVCESYQNECDGLLKGSLTADAWFRIADRLGFMLCAQRAGAQMYWLDGWHDMVNQRFFDWLNSGYQYLSGMSSKRQPYLMNQVLDYIRRQNAKTALIVMDGMSFADFYLVQKYLTDLGMQTTGLFSFIPSITSVARQSLFSGFVPAEHEKPFSLQNEEKQWRAYWKENEYLDYEIAFAKDESPELPSYTKIAGIVINIVDDLMHSELQGGIGMYKSLMTWLEKGSLRSLIKRLRYEGYTVYMTADHGNTTSIAQGRFMKPSIITEDASRRAVIYQGFAGAEELDKFTVSEYTGTYLPSGYRYFTFDQHCCYGDAGTEYVAHGGRTIEELIVPFTRIGE